MAALGYDITLGGFIVVAIIAIGLMLFARHDRLRSIRFGFFFEHERTKDPDDEEAEIDQPTRVMWPIDQEEEK